MSDCCAYLFRSARRRRDRRTVRQEREHDDGRLHFREEAQRVGRRHGVESDGAHCRLSRTRTRCCRAQCGRVWLVGNRRLLLSARPVNRDGHHRDDADDARVLRAMEASVSSHGVRGGKVILRWGGGACASQARARSASQARPLWQEARCGDQRAGGACKEQGPCTAVGVARLDRDGTGHGAHGCRCNA